MPSGASISRIPVIDIFAGPGGLGEGFAAPLSNGRRSPFKIGLSIEMDPFARRTLLLRSFYRQFDVDTVPDEYYKYLQKGTAWEDTTLRTVFARFPVQVQTAENEAWQATLGDVPENEVDRKIRGVVGSNRAKRPWVLIGGPPCQAYSLIGRVRSFAEHGDKFYEDRKHTLYKEYLRILAVHKPTVFVMENVKGLLSSRLRGGELVLEQILRDLEAPSKRVRYDLFSVTVGSEGDLLSAWSEVKNPRAFIVKCENYGIPQARHRLIVLGIRRGGPIDLTKLEPLCPANGLVNSKQVLKGLPPLRSGLSRRADSESEWLKCLKSAVRQDWFLDLEQSEQKEISNIIRTVIESLKSPLAGRGAQFVPFRVTSGYKKDWYLDHRLSGACNHETRGHMAQDLYRYLFASAFAQAHNISPRLQDLPTQ